MLRKIFSIIEGKHYRYLIIGFVVFVINFKFTLFFSALQLFSDKKLSMFVSYVISIEIALLISFPLHKYITWLESDATNIYKQLLRFHWISLFGIILRLLLFYWFLSINFGMEVSIILSTGTVVLLNFVGFELVVFTDKSKMQIQENEFVYGYSGNGIVALETVEEAKLYNKWIAEKIEDYLGDKNLEIGAGTGTIASILSERYPLYLYEISKANNEFLKERFKDNSNIVSIGFDFLSVDETEKFSCIYSSNVLEHLEDDVHFVNKGLDLLKVGGFFVAIVPAMMVLFSSFDKSIGHYRRYTKNDIKRWKTALSNRDDIKIIASDYFNPIGAVGWYIKMKLLKQKKINKSDALLMNAIIPFVSWLDLFWFGFGQSMLIVLKKVK